MTRARRLVVVGIAVLVVVLLAGSLAIGAFGLGSTGSGSTGSGSSQQDTGPDAASTPDRSDASSSPESPDPGAPDAAAASALFPIYPEPLTVEAVSVESTRVADLMVGFIDAGPSGESNVINDDEIAQVIEAGGEESPYFGVLHTLTLDPAVDAAAQVEALQGALVAGGWTEREVTDTAEQYLVVLTAGTAAERSWFLVVGADRSVPGESVVSIQLASPGLPQ